MKCPVCKKEIDHLTAMGYVRVGRDFMIGPNNIYYWGEADTDFEEVFDEFLCPECGTVIASTQQDAEKYLKESNVDPVYGEVVEYGK